MAKQVYVVGGLGFGDEGKGSVVDALCHRTRVHSVIRYNGGAQAAHNVVLADDTHHTFAQFGSGTFQGARTHLSRHMRVNPIFFESEGAHLIELGVERPQDLVTFEGDALVTTPYHVAANRLKELQRGRQRHGSCGMGVGETVQDSLASPQTALRIRDLKDPDAMAAKLRQARTAQQTTFPWAVYDHPASEVELDLIHDPDFLDELIERYRKFARNHQIVGPTYLSSLLQQDETFVFEGAQGLLLDEDFGFHPYTTWSHTTFAQAKDLLRGHLGTTTFMGVLRAYHTRHGPGPFPTEDPQVTHPDHNGMHEWQREFRFGHFDMVLARYAQKIAGCDALALTCLDQVECPKVCDHYQAAYGRVKELRQPHGLVEQEVLGKFLGCVDPRYSTFDRKDFLDYVSTELAIPVAVTSEGPTAQDKTWR